MYRRVKRWGGAKGERPQSRCIPQVTSIRRGDGFQDIRASAGLNHGRHLHPDAPSTSCELRHESLVQPFAMDWTGDARRPDRRDSSQLARCRRLTNPEAGQRFVHVSSSSLGGGGPGRTFVVLALETVGTLALTPLGQEYWQRAEHSVVQAVARHRT